MDTNNPFSLSSGPPFAGQPGSNPPPPALGLPPHPHVNPPSGPDISALRAAALQSSRNKLAQAVARQPVMPAYEDEREAAPPVLSLAERLNPKPMPSLAARIGGRKAGPVGGDWEEGEITEGEEARRREGNGAMGGKAWARGEGQTKRSSNSQIQAAFDEARGKANPVQAQKSAAVATPVSTSQPEPFPRPRSPGYHIQHDAGAPLYAHGEPFALPPSDSFAPFHQEQNGTPLAQPYQPHPLPAPVVHRPTQEELYRPPRARPILTQEELYRPPRDKRPTQEELYRPPQPKTRLGDVWRPETDDTSNIPLNRPALADSYRQPPPPLSSPRDYYRGPADPFPRQRSPGPAPGYSDPFPRQRSPIHHDPFPRQWSPLPPPPLHQDPFPRQRSPPPRPSASRYETYPRERPPAPHLDERSPYLYDPYDPYAPEYGEVSYRPYDASRPRSPLPMRARTPPRPRSPPRPRTPPRPRSPPPPPVRYEERQPEPRPPSPPLPPAQNEVQKEVVQVDARPRSPSIPPPVSSPHRPNTPPAPLPPLRVEPPTPMVADVRRKEEGGADTMDMMSSDAPIAAAAADFTPAEARDYMDIIRNLIYEGFTPEVLVSRGATAKYVMAVCEEIVDSTKKRKSLWLDPREPEPERVDSPDHHEPSRAKMIRTRSPTPELEAKVEEQSKEDAGSDDEPVAQRMEMPERVSGAPPTPDLPSPALQPASQGVKVESYRPSKSPTLAVEAAAESATSPRLQELLPPSLSVPDLPPAPTSTSPTAPVAVPVSVVAPTHADKKPTKRERMAQKTLREGAEHGPVTPPLPAAPLPLVQAVDYAAASAVPVSPGYPLPARPGTTSSLATLTRKERRAAAAAKKKAKKQQQGASESVGDRSPQQPSTAPPAIPPPPPDFATQNALLETRRKALESMRARRSAVAASAPPPAPTVANLVQWRTTEDPAGPRGSAAATGTGSGTPAALTAEDMALQRSIDQQMAELEQEMLGLQKTTADARAREEQQQGSVSTLTSASGANDEVDMDVEMEMESLEEGEITPASAPPSAPPSAQPAAATLLPPKPSTSTTPILIADVLPRRNTRRVAAEDLMESRPSSAPPRSLPPAKRKPFGGVMRMNRLILNLDESDSSDDESDPEAEAKRKEEEAEEKQKALDENIRRLKAEIAARKKRRLLAEANGGGSGSATPSGAGTPVSGEQKVEGQQRESKELESGGMSRNQSDANFDIVRGAVEETSKGEDSAAKATAKMQADTDVRHLQAQLADAEAEAEAMEVDTAMEEAPPSAADISNVEEQVHELMEVDTSGADAEEDGVSVVQEGDGQAEGEESSETLLAVVHPASTTPAKSTAVPLPPTNYSSSSTQQTSNYPSTYTPLLPRYPILSHTILSTLPAISSTPNLASAPASAQTAASASATAPNALGPLDRYLLSTIVLTNRLQTEPNATLCRAEVGGGKCADKHCKDLHTNKGLPTGKSSLSFLMVSGERAGVELTDSGLLGVRGGTDKDLIDYVLAVRGEGRGREEWARVAQAVLSAKMSIAKASTPVPASAAAKTGGKGKGRAEASGLQEDPLERLLDKVGQILSS